MVYIFCFCVPTFLRCPEYVLTIARNSICLITAEMNCPFRRHTKRNERNNSFFFFSNPNPNREEAIEIEVARAEEEY